MKRLPFIVLLSAALPAAAQVYKCTQEGKPTTYSQAPCERGAESVLATPPAPAADPAAKASLKKMQAESKALEKARLAGDAQQEREAEATNRAAAKRREKCDKLRLAQKWADEDARRAQPTAVDAARLKARRAGERVNVECP